MNGTTTIGTTTTITNVIVEMPVEQLSSISETLKQIQGAISQRSFFDSQLFGAIVGASSAILVFLLGLAWNAWRERSRTMGDLYSSLVSRVSFFSPDAIVSEADRHMFGGKISYADGTSVETPDKTRGEKSVIMLQRKVNYRRLPVFSKLRCLFRRYERALTNMPNIKRSELKNDERYKKAQSLYEEIEKHLYAATGENEYTA